MEGFRYVDLFATKDLEYLLVIGFLVAFVVIWKLMSTAPETPRSGRVRTRLTNLDGWFRLNDEVRYHPAHAWAAPVGAQVVKVGVDDFAQKLLGQADSIDLPLVGSRMEQGKRGWRLGLRSRFVDMLSPVAGEVVEVNHRIFESPGLVNEDPYGEGWLLKIRTSSDRANFENLLSGRYARAWMDETVHALRERMSRGLGTVLQDGGVPVSGFVFALAPERWDEVAAEFLSGTERVPGSR